MSHKQSGRDWSKTHCSPSDLHLPQDKGIRSAASAKIFVSGKRVQMHCGFFVGSFVWACVRTWCSTWHCSFPGRMNEWSSTDPFQLPKESYPFLLAAKRLFPHQLLPRECYSHRMCTVQPPATPCGRQLFSEQNSPALVLARHEIVGGRLFYLQKKDDWSDWISSADRWFLESVLYETVGSVLFMLPCVSGLEMCVKYSLCF